MLTLVCLTDSEAAKCPWRRWLDATCKTLLQSVWWAGDWLKAVPNCLLKDNDLMRLSTAIKTWYLVDYFMDIRLYMIRCLIGVCVPHWGQSILAVSFIPETPFFLELWHLLMDVCLHFDWSSSSVISTCLCDVALFLQLWLRCSRRDDMSCTVRYGSIIHAVEAVHQCMPL
jgi:hypothetical protein